MTISMSTNKLSMRILFLVLVCMSIISTPVQYLFAQQQYPVQIQPSVSFPSTFLSDYADPANTSIRVYLADMTKQNYTINIRIQLTSTNISYTSLYGINVTLDGGQVYFLNANELARLFALTDLKVVASSQGNEPNSLPEGPYNLALQAFDVTLLPTLVPVSNIRTDFTIFNVMRYDPPLLNAPMNKQEFDLQTTNQNIFFNWTPRHIVYSPNQRIQYRYRMIRVIPVDRNPYDAVNTSLAGATGNIDVNNLDFPAFSYSPADLKLEPGAVYAWQVQAYETVNGQKSTSRFKNQGYSEVFTFSVKEHCEQITLGTPLVMGNSVKFNWNSGISSEYKEYEFNYRKVGSNTGWIPVSTLENTITLDNTVLETGVSYEYNVRARCNNWLLPVQGGNFTLATPTCVPPSPLTVNTSGNATVLSWPQAKSVDSLKLYYKITGSSDPYRTLGLNAADVQCSLPLLTSGGYTIHLDALCGTEQSAGAENSFAFDETGIVGPCPIPLPFQLTANRIKGDTASLQWNTVAGAHTGSAITYWHKDSSTVTYTLSAITTSAGTGVSGRHIYNDQVYSYQITYQCGNKTKVTPVGMFRILSASAQVAIDPQTANCFPPVDIRAEARDSVSARVEWDKISGAESYELSYRVKGTTGLFTTFNTTATSTTLKPLQANAQYQLLVRVKCNGLFSIYSDTALLDLTVARNRNCDTIAYFKTLNKTTGNIQVAWDYDSTNTGYIIKYREEAQPIATEYTQAFTNIDSLKQNNLVLPDTFKYTFQNLKAGTKYIFRIQKICGQNNALFNAPLVVSTMPDTKSTGACGSGNVCDKNPATKLQSLKVTDTIYCADYLVVVDSITTATSNPSMGLYSGLGHMEMPVPGLGDFVNMHVSFNNVKINGKPNSCVYDGTINIDSMNASIIPIKIRDSIKAIMAKAEEIIDQANEVLNQIQTGIDDAQAATQDGIDYFQGGEGVGNVKTGGLGETEAGAKISKTTRTATVGTNSVTIDGRTVPVTSVPVLIKDSDGQVFQVSPAGVVTYLGVYNTAFAKDTTLDLSAQIVTYEEAAGAVYDFDKRETAYSVSTQIDREYEKIGTSYYVPAKFITPGALDKVTATLSGSSADPAKVVFTNGKGFVYEKGTATGNSFTLNVAGGPASDGQYIYAWYVDGDSKKAIGKLLLPSYAPQVKNVVIVPVKGNQTFNPATYETYLNQTYQKVGITYHVTLDNSFRTNTAWSTDGNLTVQSSASGLLSNDYQGKEKAIVQAYVAFKGGAANLDPNTAYFMTVYEPSLIKDGATTLLGKMPAEEQFGFLYSGSFPASGSGQDEGLKRTMAHELGHGAYHMEHTFNAIYLRETSRNNTTNLMDYAAGNQLWKFQWDIIHAPGHVWGILKRDRDAQALTGEDLPKLLKLINDLRPAYIRNDATFDLSGNEYRLGYSTTDVTIDFQGLSRSYKIKRPGTYISAYMGQATPIALTKPLAVTYRLQESTVADRFLYSITFKYVGGPYQENNLALEISSVDYDNIKAILLYWGLSEPNFSGMTTFLNSYYDPNHDCDEIDVYYEGIPDQVAATRSIEDLKADIRSMALCDINEGGTDEESAIINAMDALGKKDPNILLDLLREVITRPIYDETYYFRLYNGLDDIGGNANFSHFTELLYKYWLVSKYNTSAAAGTKVDVIPYTSSKWFSFYFDNVDIESTDGDKNLSNNLIYENEQTDVVAVFGSFDLYAPIYLADISQATITSNGLSIPDRKLPLFYLKSFDRKNQSSNAWTGTKLTTDAILTFSGVGNLAKLRYLRALSSLDKLSVMIGAIEVTSGITDILLTYSECSTPFCNAINSYLFWIEVATFSTDYATQKKIVEAARYARSLGAGENATVLNHLDDVIEGGIVLTHIIEADITALQKVTSVTRSGGVRAINNVKNLVNEGKALVFKPIANSVIAQKMDDYIAAYNGSNSALQGQLGEDIAELMAKELNTAENVVNIKINSSGNGFDVLSFAPNKTSPTSVRIFEAKPLNSTSVELPSTLNGPQMSNTWTQNNINQMRNHSDSNIQQIGNSMNTLMLQNKVERFVVTIDKTLKQIIILKLDNF
jgi:hypothetical protein